VRLVAGVIRDIEKMINITTKELKMNEFIKTMNKFQKMMHKNAVDHGWHDKPVSFGTTCMNIVREVSEAFDEYARHREVTEVYYKGEKPEGIPVELADIFIRICDFCEKENISLGEVAVLKHKFNKTRSYRHGNKKV